MLSALFAVALGGALGAVARFGTVTLIHMLVGNHFPLGTLVVNCIGSFLIGSLMSLLIGRIANEADFLRLFVIVGFLGAYTTFSSFSWETWILYGHGEWIKASMNVLSNTVGSLLFLGLGVWAGRLLGGN